MSAQRAHRVPQRYKPRTLTTAVGDFHLLVPQDRDSAFSTALFERYQRSDMALVVAIMEMYGQCVSTRKVADVTGNTTTWSGLFKSLVVACSIGPDGFSTPRDDFRRSRY